MASKDTLVFSGGGSRGFAYIGMFEIIERFNIDFISPKRKIKTIIGTSIGSLFGALIAAGTTSKEMYNVSRHLDLYDLIDMQISNLHHSFGLSKTGKIESIIDMMIKNKIGVSNVTMKRFRELTGITLRILVTNVTLDRLEVWDADSMPNQKLNKVLMTSMLLPGILIPTMIDKIGQCRKHVAISSLCTTYTSVMDRMFNYMKSKKVLGVGDIVTVKDNVRIKVSRVDNGHFDGNVIETSFFVDGGIKCNFGVHLVKNPSAALGFFIRIPRNEPNIPSVEKYLTRLAYSVMARSYPCSCDVVSVTVPFGNILDFKTNIDMLVQLGRDAMLSYLNKDT